MNCLYSPWREILAGCNSSGIIRLVLMNCLVCRAPEHMMKVLSSARPSCLVSLMFVSIAHAEQSVNAGLLSAHFQESAL